MDRTGIGSLLVCLLCLSTRVLGQNMVNVAVNDQRTCGQSSFYVSEDDACNAANGNTGGTYSATGDSANCIHTSISYVSNGNGQTVEDRTPQWQVDLGGIYPVQDITVWGRNVETHRLYPFNITVDGQHCARAVNGGREISVTCGTVLNGQKVLLTRDYKAGWDYSLNMCELKVWVCQSGYHRVSIKTCEPCSINCDRGCDRGNGRCYGCKSGYHGAQCDSRCSTINNRCTQCTQDGICTACSNNFQAPYCTVCPSGYHKVSDTCEPCNTNCDNRGCNSYNGRCYGCKPGYHGAQCDSQCSTIHNRCTQCNQDGTCTTCSNNFQAPACTECLDGYYKQSSWPTSCTKCSNTTGDCANCPPGKTGNRCDQACAPNTYGENCSESCGRCKGEQPCNATTGQCTGECQPGYTGKLCKTECEAGLYGEKCNETCGNCQVNTSCHHENGHCLVACEAEFTGPLCLQAASISPENNLVGPIVGAIVGVGLVMTISVTAAICWRRRRATSRSSGQDPPSASAISVKDSAPTVSPEPSSQRQSSSNEDNPCSEIRDPNDIYEITEMQSIYDKPSPYSNDDGDREPYMQLTPKTNDVHMPASNAAYVNTTLSV